MTGNNIEIRLAGLSDGEHQALIAVDHDRRGSCEKMCDEPGSAAATTTTSS